MRAKTAAFAALAALLLEAGTSASLAVAPVSATSGPGLGASYVPLAPQRILDTRITGTPVGSNSTENLTVTGVDSVPADAAAVVLNVTVTAPSHASYLTVYPAGERTPNVSNLNFSPGESVANLTVVPVGVNGQVVLYNESGSVQVLVDLEGYFETTSGSSTAGSYVGLTPARITDTRAGSGEPNSGDPLMPGGTLNVQVDGEGGVPSSGVEAVAVNVTVTDTTKSSYLTAYPSGSAMPRASNLNWWPRDTVANLVIAPVGVSGQVSIYNSQGDADLVVDVVGYFTDGASTPSDASLYYPMSPIRALDARTAGAHSYLSKHFAGVDGISSTADGIVANLTSTDATEAGYFSVVPEQTTPTTSDTNFSAHQTMPNLVLATLNSGGGTNIYNYQGTADTILDVFGFFEPEATASTSDCDVSGQPMPVGNIPGWDQVVADDFCNVSVPLGTWPGALSSTWSAYPNGWPDTSGTGTYNCTLVCSVQNGELDLYLHTVNGVHYVAVPYPLLLGGSADNGQLYGAYAVRFKADPVPGYKTAWLLWPDAAKNSNIPYGEIDFPEGQLNSTFSAFMHFTGASGQQDAYPTSDTYATWHTAVIEWVPGSCTFILDGVVIGTSTTSVPNTPMHWVLQTETQLSGGPPNDTAAGHVDVAWVAVYRPA
jgi:hypothetical protein